MFLRSHEVRRLGLLALAAVAVLAPSHAGAASATANYVCEFPLIGEEPMSVAYDADISSVIAADEPTGAIRARLDATPSPVQGIFLDLIGSSRLEGSATVGLQIEGPGIIAPVEAPFALKAIDKVESEPMAHLVSDGFLPSLQFPVPGQGRILLKELRFSLTAFRPDGTPVVLPAPEVGDSDGDHNTFDVPCRLDPEGQDVTLTSFDIGPLPDPLSPTIESAAGYLREVSHGVIVVTGTNLKTVNSVVVDDRRGTVLSRTKSRLVIDLPARPAGVQPLVLTSPSGNVRTTIVYH